MKEEQQYENGTNRVTPVRSVGPRFPRPGLFRRAGRRPLHPHGGRRAAGAAEEGAALPGVPVRLRAEKGRGICIS